MQRQKLKYKPKIKYRPKEEAESQLSTNRSIFSEKETKAPKKNYKEKESNQISRPTEERKKRSPIKISDKSFKKSNDKVYICNDPHDLQNAHDRIDQSDSRKLKKLFKMSFPGADCIIIKYQVTKPIIFFECVKNGQIKLIHIRDVLAANQSLKQEKKLFQRIYNILYKSLPVQYFHISKFGAQYAKKRRLQFHFRQILGEIPKFSKRSFDIFYTVKNKDEINFVIFDSRLGTVEFSSKNIQSMKKQYNRQYKLFQKFLQKEIYPNHQQLEEQMVQGYNGGEQIDSDQEERQVRIKNRIKMGIDEIYQKIKKIKTKDLSSYEDDIELKNDEFDKYQNQNQIEEAQKAAEEVMQMNENLENFKKIRDDVEDRMKQSSSYEVLMPCLKRLIIAQKQLISQLPIIAKKREIFQKLDKNNLLILEGETGSGKSTQLPQMLCEYYNIFHNPKALPVLVTQPRKLATRTLAERVAYQMEEEVHGFVDYQASAISDCNKMAKIIFKMDRIVLDQLKTDETLSKYCCLVIDEAHERTISIDVILGLIKNLLQKRKDFKIIVTSASMDTELFKKYFKTQILKVSGRMYPVEEIYKPYSSLTSNLEKLEKLFNEEIVAGIHSKYKGHILVFCSGLEQIQRFTKRFKSFLNPRVFKVLPLHGRLSQDQQKQVFLPTELNKVIFATRVAETSITIDGVKVVVDPGEDIEQQYDQKTKITSMRLAKISQSSAKQRAGRAGRTNEGFCFRLYSKQDKTRMESNKKPEIKNMALDTLVLRLKSLQIEDVLNFPYVTPPDPEALKASIKTVKMLGCLDNKSEKITQIGNMLVKLPIQPFLSRAIVEAQIFKLLINKGHLQQVKQMPDSQKFVLRNTDIQKSIVEILSLIVNASNIFFVRQEQAENADRIKYQNLSAQEGDFFFFLNIMEKYLSFVEKKQFRKLNQWMNNHFLNKKTMKQAEQVFREVQGVLNRFTPHESSLKDSMNLCLMKLKNCKSINDVLLSCLITSFASNLCLFSGNNNIGYTLLQLQIPVKMYGTSTLSLQGINPKWVVCYELYENIKNEKYFKVAHQVDYNFLLQHVDDYILKEYQIQQANKFDPFYEHLAMKVQTLVFQKVSEKSHQKEELREDIFSKMNMVFYQDLNQIEVFYLKKKFIQTRSMLNTSIFNKIKFRMGKMLLNEVQDTHPSTLVHRFFDQIQANFRKIFRYNYVGPVSIELKDGFQLFEIRFKMQETKYTVTSSSEILQELQNYFEHLGNLEKYEDRLIFYIYEEENIKEFSENFKFLKQFYDSESKPLKLRQEIVDRRNKVPQAKIFLRFWAGQSPKDNILIKFNYSTTETRNCLEKIKEGIVKALLQGYQTIFQRCRFSLTKKGDAINLFPERGFQTDEYEVSQEFINLDRHSYFGYDFSMPISIKKFREPDITQALTTQAEWQRKIEQYLRKCGCKKQHSTIRVWGYYEKPRKEGPKQGIENQYKVDLHAQIKSFNMMELQKFQKKFDGQRGVLGTEKLHCGFQYEQMAAVTTDKVFQALYEEFQFLRDNLKKQFPQISIDHFRKKMKTLTKVFIKIRGVHREHLLKPTKQLNTLFTPKYITINDSKFLFLSKFSQGEKILDKIESKHNYKIYFGFQKKSKKIKLYCEHRLEKPIRDQLEAELQKFKCFEEIVSYQGKNLHKVEDVLKQLKDSTKSQNQKNKYVNYEIIFKFRKIKITGDPQTVQIAKNKINSLVEKGKGQCEICCDLLQRPYRLMNCKHQFCWLCLSSYIKQSITSMTKQLIECPLQKCKKINIYDIKAILSEEDFNKLCDIQISRMIERSQKYHSCYSPNCQNIFLKVESEVQNSFECELCGKWYCTKCKESHKTFSCQQWKVSISNEILVQLGIKKCPKCGQGIQKNKGCQHVECKNCKCHICWNCMKFFKTSGECYGHLEKDHGSFM